MPDPVINVGSDHTLPVVPSGPGAEVVVNVTAGDTVYYADTPAVTSASNQGSATAAGSPVTFTKQVWLRSASLSQVAVSNVAATGRVPGAVAARGLIAESTSLMAMAGATATVPTQQICCSLVGLVAGDIVTNIVPNVTTAAAGTTPTLIKLGIVRKDGLVLATTANVTADAQWTSTGFKSFPLSSPFTVSSSDGYYVAILENGVFGTTPLQLLRVGSTLATSGVQLGTGARSFALGGTGQTDITGTLTLADPGAGLSFWFGVS